MSETPASDTTRGIFLAAEAAASSRLDGETIVIGGPITVGERITPAAAGGDTAPDTTATHVVCHACDTGKYHINECPRLAMRADFRCICPIDPATGMVGRAVEGCPAHQARYAAQQYADSLISHSQPHFASDGACACDCESCTEGSACICPQCCGECGLDDTHPARKRTS